MSTPSLQSMGVRPGQAPDPPRGLWLYTQGHLEGAFQVQQTVTGLHRGPWVPTVPPRKFGKQLNVLTIHVFYPYILGKILNVFPIIFLGLGEEGGADLLSSPFARRTVWPTSEEDAGPSVI